MTSYFDSGIFSVNGLSGEVLAGAQLNWYAAGTSTRLATYSDRALTTPHTNPIIADASGRFPFIWLQKAEYKYVLTDADGNILKTQDNIVNAVDDDIDQIYTSISGIQDDITAIETDIVALQAETLNAQLLGKALRKAHLGNSATAACEGTSLTYGQDTSGTAVPGSQINGATQTRGPQNYPLNMQESFALAGLTLTVTNRGFPGDTIIQGTTRWASAPITDIVFIEYGTNEPNNYGGNGVVSVEAYAAAMAARIQWHLNRGTAVILLGSPNVKDLGANLKIQPYRVACQQLAVTYGCPFIDIGQMLQTVTSPWTDGVHLTSFAYAEWGWMLGAFVAGGAGDLARVRDGDTFYPTDALLRGGLVSVNGGFLLDDARAECGTFYSLDTGTTMLIAVDVVENVHPVIHTYQDSNDATIGVYYAGGTGATRGLPTIAMVHQFAVASQQSVVGPPLRPGLRLVAIRNDGATTIYFQKIQFVKEGVHSSRGIMQPVPHMTVHTSPLIASGLAAYDMGGNFSHKLKAPFKLSYRHQLSSAGARVGIGLWAGPACVSTDFVSLNGIAIIREGTALKVYELTNGAEGAVTTIAAVFSAGVTFDDVIDIDYTTANVKVYVSGVLKATVATPTYTKLYPGWITAKTEKQTIFSVLSTAPMKEGY